MATSTTELIGRIQNLSPEEVAEVQDFVEFVHQRHEKKGQNLTQENAGAVSEVPDASEKVPLTSR